MIQWIFTDITAFTIVAVITGFIIPQILLIAFRRNLFDHIDPRKIHQGAVPRLGGIAFFPAILFALLVLMGTVFLHYDESMIEAFTRCLAQLCFIICAIIVLYLNGMADDLIGVKYRAKFVAQIVAAALIITGGITLTNLHGFLWITDLDSAWSIMLTLLLTVFITNAINLIDGIDGLASGLSAIACAFYGYICFNAGEHVYALLAFATLGALVPFFYYNVFGNVEKHRKIFMGDTGALTIGLILSALSIKICSLPDTDPTMNMGVAAFAPLLIPCCDVVRVYMLRIAQRRSPFLPDKNHIHHRLLRMGMSQRTAMPTIVLISVLLTTFNIWASGYVNITLLLALDIALWLAANLALTVVLRRKKRNAITEGMA